MKTDAGMFKYTHFCCGQDDAARSCCTDGNGTVLLAAGTAILPTATITLNTTIPATNTQSYASPSTTTTSTTVSTNCDPAGGASTAIKGGLGAATGFAALVAVIFAGLWIWQTSKLKKTETELRDAKRRLTALEPPKPLSRWEITNWILTCSTIHQNELSLVMCDCIQSPWRHTVLIYSSQVVFIKRHSP